MHQIDPRKFTAIINEADIIFKAPNRWRRRTPNIRKISSRGDEDLRKELVYGNGLLFAKGHALQTGKDDY